jgi:cobalt-zinc-cadmium efflux system protein
LNSAFVLIEAGFGLWSGSMALVADAGHNLSDVLSLLIAWGAAYMSTQPASPRYTYGYKSSSILAALANAGLLLVALGAILLETIDRLFDPRPSKAWTMVAVAGIGIVVNGATALMFMPRAQARHQHPRRLPAHGGRRAGLGRRGRRGRRDPADRARWIDPLTSLVIVGSSAGAPGACSRTASRWRCTRCPTQSTSRGAALPRGPAGVPPVHDLHIWPMSTTETALTAHLVMPRGYPGDAILHEVAHELEHRFRIGHRTVQWRRATSTTAPARGARHRRHHHD